MGEMVENSWSWDDCFRWIFWETFTLLLVYILVPVLKLWCGFHLVTAPYKWPWPREFPACLFSQPSVTCIKQLQVVENYAHCDGSNGHICWSSTNMVNMIRFIAIMLLTSTCHRKINILKSLIKLKILTNTFDYGNVHHLDKFPFSYNGSSINKRAITLWTLIGTTRIIRC